MARFRVLIVGNKTVYVDPASAPGASMLDMPGRQDERGPDHPSRRPTDPLVRDPFEDDLEDY